MLPGVQPHAVGAGVDRLDRERVVEVDVGDHGDRRLRDDLRAAPRRPARAGRRRARCRRRPPRRCGSAPSSPRGSRSRSWSSSGRRRARRRRSARSPTMIWRSEAMRCSLRTPSTTLRCLAPRRSTRPRAARCRASPSRSRSAPAPAATPASWSWSPRRRKCGSSTSAAARRPARPRARARRHRRRPRRAARLSGPVRRAPTPSEGLPFADGEFDLAYCTSVIEHVPRGAPAAFAAELRRVARGWYVQTPARSFPIEPHSLLPGAQWLPAALRRLYWRLGATGAWEDVALLGRGELEALFGAGRARALRTADEELGQRAAAVGRRRFESEHPPAGRGIRG